LANPKETIALRLNMADELQQILGELQRRPPQEDVLPALLPALVLPRSGLASSGALAAAAVKGQLQGPLPLPRMLTFHAVRPGVRALFAKDADPDIRAAAAGVLSKMHLVMHGIFKPDENAQGQAVQKYRERFPAAARASQSIVIYPTALAPAAGGVPAIAAAKATP
jgi:hypothetical protein